MIGFDLISSGFRLIFGWISGGCWPGFALFLLGFWLDFGLVRALIALTAPWEVLGS